MSDFNLPKIENSVYSPFEKVAFYSIFLNNFSLLVTIKDGVAWESDSFLGYGHFLEHVNFQKTDKYKSFMALASFAESMGAKLSAFTSRDSVTYGIYAPSWSLKEAFEIMTSILSHLEFNDEVIDEEKKIVFREMDRDKLNFRDFAVMQTESELLSPNPISRYSLGTQKSLSSINSKSLSDYKSEVYCRENISIVLCGGFDASQAEELTATMLESLPGGKERKLREFSQKTPEEKIKKFDFSAPSNQVRMIKYFSLPKPCQRFWLPASILNTLLGVGFSCLFYEKLRHENKLVYTLATQMKLYSETSLFRFVADINPEHISLADNLINDVLFGVISEENLTIAKNKYWGDIALKLSDMKAFSEFVARRFFLDNELIHLGEIYETLKSINPDMINDFVRNNFDKNKSILGVC